MQPPAVPAAAVARQRMPVAAAAAAAAAADAALGDIEGTDWQRWMDQKQVKYFNKRSFLPQDFCDETGGSRQI
eukprot:COSAG06_NODE_67221_length_252_cov_1.006536_1_plen_72_part_01